VAPDHDFTELLRVFDRPPSPIVAAVHGTKAGDALFQSVTLHNHEENTMTTQLGSIAKTSTIDTVAKLLGRYGLVVVIGWIGLLKFANYEAHQIQPLVANSPFMGWLYHIFPVYTFSALLGVVEVTAAVLLAIKPVAPKLSIVGSLLAIVLFVGTTSFLFTTPGLGEPAGGGFPAITLLGEFLLKDIPLLGLSFWTLADAIRATQQRSNAE
jgi:reactive chlorine resistance protein C